MAIARVNLADLQQTIPLVDANGLPTPAFLRYLNTVIQSLKNSVNDLVDVQNAADAANAAAAAASAAAATANASADTANTAATVAQTTAETAGADAALANSWVVPSSVIHATPTVISIDAHDRYYADGTSVSVFAGTVAATAVGDVDYVIYSDPTHAGGAVTYAVTTDTPAQVGGIHVVGAITIPASGTVTGGQGPKRPGDVNP